MIRLLLVEDQALVLGALAALLALEGDMQVVAQAQSAEEALPLLQELRPDLLLADIELPGMSGLELASEVRQRGLPTRVVILTTFARAGYLRRALEAGVAGYLLKDMPAPALAEALRRVHQGGRAIEPELALSAWSEPNPLSERERAVLRRAALGQTSAQIAAALGLSEGTVRNYLSEAIGKLGAANRIEAARIAREKGFI